MEPVPDQPQRLAQLCGLAAQAAIGQQHQRPCHHPAERKQRHDCQRGERQCEQGHECRRCQQQLVDPLSDPIEVGDQQAGLIGPP